MRKILISIAMTAALGACDGAANEGAAPRTFGPTFDGGTDPSPGDGGLPSPTHHCGAPGRSGVSDCFATDCTPGQFCRWRDGSTTATCVSGCVSDQQCVDGEICYREPGQAVGSCAPCRDLEIGAPEAGCGDSSRSGITDCFAGDCTPGQYCDESAGATRGTCRVGCTSDANCGPQEHCARELGESVGECAPCYSVRVPVSGETERCLGAVERAAECGAAPPTELAQAREGCRALPEALSSAVACVEAAGDCEAVAACLEPHEPVPDPEGDACREHCMRTGARCADAVAFPPTAVEWCLDECRFAPGRVSACLEAASAGADPEVSCAQAAACL